VSAPDLAPGTVVGGRYTVASRIGRGTMSTTYRASNGDTSEVALKVYDPSLPVGTLDSMRRAGEAAAAITSAAIAPLDAGVDPASGAPFAVQELSARPSLAQLVELCPLAPTDAVALARSLARALAPLHERGVAHGALAPGNVFVGPPPACEVRLSDFAAPRQEQEQDPSAAVATDVEGAARIVSFALTGRPFGSPGPEPDRAWSTVFRRAMHPRPGEAYVSLDALADSFERAARGEGPPVLITPPPPSEATPGTRSKKRMSAPWKVGLGLIACLVLAVAVAVALKLTRRSHARPAATAVVAEAPPSAPPLASEVPSASEAPSASAAPSASESAAVDNEPPPEELTIPPHDHRHGLLVIACTPSCDSVFVDGHLIAHPEQGALIDPGVHSVGANLANHPGKVQAVQVHQGRVKRLHVAF
jgi:serine/threonine protein kinase